jgi:dephospho-CoA kinase
MRFLLLSATTMRVYGLTGGIASGKSTVARMLADLGVPVVDADQVARDVVAPGQPALDEIVRAFGPEVLQPDGALDRKRLGARVFADDAARARLNAITHPRIALETQARLAQLAAAGHPLAVYEATLLVENGTHRLLAGLIVCKVDEAEQVARAMRRDHLSADEARARLAAQAPLADKLAVADHVIDTSGTVEQTRHQVTALLERLRS